MKVMAFSNVNDLNENTKSSYIIGKFFSYYVIPYQKVMLVLVHAGLNTYTLRKTCPYSKLFWSAFSRIRTKYREILRISPY